jgi:hypothetical protein
MSEKIYACLLRLYPVKFRQAYGEDALQVFRDRLHDETGFFRRLRLWLDILVDLAVSLPGQYVGVEPAFAVQTSAGGAGAPVFIILEHEFLRLRALLSGLAFSLVVLSLSIALLQASALHRLNLGSTQSAFSSTKSRLTSAADKSHSSAPRLEQATLYAPGSFVTSGEFFPPPIDYLALTNVRRNPNVQRVFVYAAACLDVAPLDAERQHVLKAVIANLKQHYFDRVVAQQMADELVAHADCGDDEPGIDGKMFAALLTEQMRAVSRDMHLEVVYNPPQPTPEEFARMLAELREDNCSFKKVQVLPHNIGYMRLDAFLEPSVCGSTATAAMSSLNNADALIFDLRNNRGGTAEMVSLISSYLFDHPEYMFDPRRVPTHESWTASPVTGSKLANKPVFILTSSTTISAAEQFTYDLKMLKRATIVGETTAGGAHAGVWHRIDDHFGMAIPEIRAVNPYSQSDWEATGVQPDIQVPASAALQAALRQAQSQLRRK